MIGSSVRVRTNRNAAGALDRATKRYLLDGAQRGYNVSQERVPHGATSFLANQSAVEPTMLGDGSVVWGYNAEYAEDVERGTPPHWIPSDGMRSLITWARRVLGDASAAWPVRRKIAREGTPPQPYVEPGAKAMRDWFAAKPMGAYIDEELGR